MKRTSQHKGITICNLLLAYFPCLSFLTWALLCGQPSLNCQMKMKMKVICQTLILVGSKLTKERPGPASSLKSIKAYSISFMLLLWLLLKHISEKQKSTIMIHFLIFTSKWGSTVVPLFLKCPSSGSLMGLSTHQEPRACLSC